MALTQRMCEGTGGVSSWAYIEQPCAVSHDTPVVQTHCSVFCKAHKLLNATVLLASMKYILY